MNSVLYWNSVLLEASRRDFTRNYVNGQQPGPIRTSRAMAIVHLAIHDAVAFRSNNPATAYLNKKGVAHGISNVTGPVDDIVAGAAVTTLKALYPAYTAFFDDAVGTVNAAAFNRGKTIGSAILAHRENDGSTTMVAGPQPSAAAYGQHRADPYAPGQPQLGPVWGDVKRFTGVPHQHLEPFPGKGEASYLDDAGYADDFEEVRELGSVTRRDRTAEQERIGIYWGYDGANSLGVPPRLYNQIARLIAQNQTPPLSLAKMAELFAVINVAMADAGIDAWYYKYEYDLWRPVVGIRQEEAPHGDPFWAPLGAPQTNAGRGTLTPPFPAYPSGHATFGAALMQALRLSLQTAPGPITVQDVLDVETGDSDPIAAETFTFVSDELDGVSSDPDGSVRTRVPVTFKNFAEPVWENAVSRVYLGVHWRFDGIPRNAAQNVGGVPLGLAIGQEAHEFFNQSPSLAGSV
jgi:Vanadium chloroperoxidase N-terminal domain/PAP2 superfamily